MTPKTKLFAGFDLGTSNSAAAIFDGQDVKVVRNSTGASVTPSVVHMDKRGRTHTGARAQRLSERDPDNAAREFKRLMGSRYEVHFPAAQKVLSPEELSAAVLSSLREDIKDTRGFAPTRAVVSVPALFELPQKKATADAARMAGFDQVELIQEPIASALAAGWEEDTSGSWLVYDLGGGTFDVSLLETREGLLRVVGHDGDNFLGGRDIDRAIVDWAITEVQNSCGTRLERRRREHAAALEMLTRAAELAKIDLSRSEESTLSLEAPLLVDGKELDVDLPITRDVLNRLCAPILARTTEVCRRLLKQNGLKPQQLSRVVLVGGPAVMPIVRTTVETALSTPIAVGHDPMTLVAQGAAIFAATAGLDASAAPKSAKKNAATVWCQYPPVSADLEPYVIGKLTRPQSQPVSVSLERIAPSDRHWRSEPCDVDSEGGFVLRAHLAPRAHNRFRIIATTATGGDVAMDPEEISIIHGLTIGDPPLSRSIGVALANDGVHTYFERGTALPARRTFIHHTVEPVFAGQKESLLSVPIVQGEFPRAHQCQLVGQLAISAEDAEVDIPGGTAVELSLLVDRGGRLSATARVAVDENTELRFEGIAQLIMPAPNIESLRASLDTAQAQCTELSTRAFKSGKADLIAQVSELQARLEEAAVLIDSLEGGDEDAGQRATRLLLDVDSALAELEAEQSWPELEIEAQDTYSWAVDRCGELGKESEARMLDKAGAALEIALNRKSVPDLMRQMRIIRRIGSACYYRDPDAYVREFRFCVARLEEMTDLPKARDLAREGELAVKASDTRALRSVVEKLFGLLPTGQTTRRLSYDSGLQ
jgi:molecular chaperone DnaK